MGLERGMISMVYNPHFRINPALSIDRETADTALSLLEECFTQLEKEGDWR
jgi:4-aminobutyrate aminotransferase-like enzyme